MHMSPQPFPHTRRRDALRALFRQLRADNNAIAYVEMAFMLPILMVGGLGGLEIANLMITHTRVSSIALAAADNASRIAAGSNLAAPVVREVDVNDVFTGAALQAGNINFEANGRMILSSLETNSVGGQWIHWQRCFGAASFTSSYGTQGTGSTGTGFAGMGPSGRQVRAAAGMPVMFVEVFYEYQPFILGNFIQNRTINYTAAFVVRDARDTTDIQNPSPRAPVQSC